MSMRMQLALAIALASGAASAADPQPEVRRPAGTPQPPGVVHTLRTIPEACARLTGVFNESDAAPYSMSATRSSATCQPRARFVDAAKAKPSIASGWKLNDEIRVPNAACPSQVAVVRVWRKPVAVKTPQLDAQGRARMYLKDAKEAAGTSAEVTAFAAAVSVEGKCR